MRVILSAGPVRAPPDAIVVDHRNHVFWRDGVALGPARHHPAYRCRQVKFPVLAALLARMPENMTGRELVDHVYSPYEDGGPDWARSSVSATIYSSKGLLARLGVRCVSRRGAERDGYRLEPLAREEGATA